MQEHPALATHPYHTFDSAAVRAQAAADPLGFLQFILTGSANLREMKGVTETLAGRASYATLWTLTSTGTSPSSRASPSPSTCAGSCKLSV